MMSKHVLDRSYAFASYPVQFRCSCGDNHTDEDWERLVNEDEMSAWTEAVKRALPDEAPATRG